eukprot:763159-Hanusia_phi.AAC.4
MWRLFLDDHGEWREKSLGLPAIPLDKFEDEDCEEPLPRAPLVLLTVSQRLVALEDSDQILSWRPCARFVGSQARKCSEAAELEEGLQVFLCDQSDDSVWASHPCRIVCLCFGSMPSLGFLPSAEGEELERAEAFLTIIMESLNSLNLKCVWMLQGFHPILKCKLEQAAGWRIQHHFFSLAPLAHSLVLPHCFAMIHHGGAGAAAAAIRHACMHIVFPITFDQMHWAKLLEIAGLAYKPQSWHSTTVDEMRSSLQFAMEQHDRFLAVSTNKSSLYDACKRSEGGRSGNDIYSPLLWWKEVELRREEEEGRGKGVQWIEAICSQIASPNM